MRLCILTITVLLQLPFTGEGKDEITKELITSQGKTRAYYLYVTSTIKAQRRCRSS